MQTIEIEIKSFEIERDLDELVLEHGSRVICADPISCMPDFISNPSGIALPLLTAQQICQFPIPVFECVLSETEIQSLLAAAQNEKRGYIRGASRMTLPEGSEASGSMGRKRPFVTGFNSSASGVLEPHIVTVDEEISMRVVAFADSDRIDLRVIWQSKDIQDVSTLKLRTGLKEYLIQKPDMRFLMIVATASLKVGQSLLLVPLCRNKRGQLIHVLITPRIRDPLVQSPQEN